MKQPQLFVDFMSTSFGPDDRPTCIRVRYNPDLDTFARIMKMIDDYAARADGDSLLLLDDSLLALCQ